MKNVWILFPAIILTSCTASTIEIESSKRVLEPISEAQIHFKTKPVQEEGIIQEVLLPRSAHLTVPFIVQAPHANWDNPYQEACEEAAVIMVDYFLRKSSIDADQANREIIQLTNWEEANRYKYDVTLDELATIVQEYYGYKTRVSDTVTIDSIKYEIAKGNPVIIPAAGRKLGNPNFSGDGPWYHMLVITGYDGSTFTTNDPGTRKGENYKYRQKTILNAIHDWTGVKEEIEQGEKKMLIITN